MKLTDIRHAEIRTLDGKKLGRVYDVQCDGGRIIALMCGTGSLLERLTARQHGHRIPWEWVRKVGNKSVVITDEPPKRARPSASRSRKGTRRPSAPRSRR